MRSRRRRPPQETPAHLTRRSVPDAPSAFRGSPPRHRLALLDRPALPRHAFSGRVPPRQRSEEALEVDGVTGSNWPFFRASAPAFARRRQRFRSCETRRMRSVTAAADMSVFIAEPLDVVLIDTAHPAGFQLDQAFARNDPDRAKVGFNSRAI